MSEKEINIIELQTQLELAQKEAEENLAGWKRAKADYLNLQRDVERNKQNWIDFASLDVMKDLLPIRNSLDELVKNLPEDGDQAWIKGMKQFQKMMDDFFRSNGVEKIKSEGERFNPEWHEAIAKEKKEDVEPDTIIKEIAPGYKMNNKLIIAPKVIISE